MQKNLTLDDETEADLRAGLSKGTRDNLSDADRAAINRFRPRSPLPRSSSLPSGESGPSVMLDSGRGETLDTPQASAPEKSGSSEKAAPVFENEEILPDDYPIYGNYIYVADGKPYRSDWHGITVRQLKRHEGFTEVRRCNICARQAAKSEG